MVTVIEYFGMKAKLAGWEGIQYCEYIVISFYIYIAWASQSHLQLSAKVKFHPYKVKF